MAESFQVDPEAHAKAKAGTIAYHEDAEGNPVVTADAPAKDDKETEVVLPTEDPDGESPEDVDAKVEGEDEDKEAEKAEGDKPDTNFADHSEQLAGWTDEFIQNGDLSPESHTKALETIFHPDLAPETREVLLNAFKEGITSTTQMSTLAGWNLTEGQENYGSMIEWARSNLNESEIKVFDAAASNGTTEESQSAIKGLYARFQQARGVEVNDEPDLAHASGKAPADPIIGSRQELAKIVASKEYKTDPAVRARVDRQIAQSQRTGNYRIS